MNDRTFLQIQVVQLRQLLENAGDDPILVPQLQERLADAEAELNAAESSEVCSQSLSIDSVNRAAERLERELEEEEISVKGLFRGLTRESVVFDLVTDEIGLITGKVADDLT